ncbi:unnamed protein product [Pylaiella littoralis]
MEIPSSTTSDDTGLKTPPACGVYPDFIHWRPYGAPRQVLTVQAEGLLFSPEPYLRSQGVQHVAAWQSRERVPHAVETTSQLVEVRLNDVGAAAAGSLLALGGARRSEEELRLVYSAVVVRAVNGLTGHEQKTAHAAPVSSLAREIGLPTWIVDIRHEAAHKQLPGIVTLRLAADFLVDYLLGKYWGPQAEHLRFLWSAFDQLISRYKATREIDASMLCNSSSSASSAGDNACPRRTRTSPAPTKSSKKQRRVGNSPTPSSPTLNTTVAAAASDSSPAPHAALAGGRPSVSKNAPHDTNTREKNAATSPVSNSKSAGPAGGKSAGSNALNATEIVAREIALSATPTALSWALVSLLADGGARVGLEDGGARQAVGGAKPRGQGHLLPRSREKYPTPGTPGVDTQEIRRRITSSRWETLLDLFHARWRGFGAALLVRLVETLLDNAAASSSRPPIVIAHLSCVGGSSTSGSGGGAGAGGGGGGGGSGGGGGGLERQAAFIEIWVRHLLSRRWHLRAGDARIRSYMREAVAAAGLSPALCDEHEASWTKEESMWADEPASSSVLEVALFPVRELVERCRRSFDAFPAGTAQQPPSRSGGGSTAGDGNIINGNGERKVLQVAAAAAAATSVTDGAVDKESAEDDESWAKAGLGAVCRALAAALPPGEAAGASPCVTPTRDNSGSGSVNGVGGSGGRVGDEGGAPQSVGGGNTYSIGGGSSGGWSAQTAESSAAAAAAAAPAAPAAEASTLAMMDLNDLERLLGAAGSSQPCSVASPEGNAGVPSAGSLGAAAAAAHGAADVKPESGFAQAEDVRVARAAAAGGDIGGGAWELMEAWTPCAIGTLPGWSAARLY